MLAVEYWESNVSWYTALGSHNLYTISIVLCNSRKSAISQKWARWEQLLKIKINKQRSAEEATVTVVKTIHGRMKNEPMRSSSV